MHYPDRQAVLSAEIDARRDDLIALTQDLIRIPTVNPPGEAYLEICEYVQRRLAARGFSTQMVRAEGTPGDSDKYPRWNVVARKEGALPGETVHFNSHHDVVEIGSGWTTDPFGGELKDGKIYGRGTCDMKGGLAASIIAAEAFADRFPDFAGAIEISATADEESGGFGGVAYLAKQGFFTPERVQHVIIPEPLNKDRICLGHRGVWWAEIETKGRIAHGSMPFLGDSAIRHMGAVIARMEDELFPALAGRTTAMPVVPPQARQSTLNINSLHGGQPEPEAGFDGFPAPVVAHSARMIIDRRYLIEESPDAVRQEMIDLLESVKSERPEFKYEVRDLWTIPPTMTAKDAPVVTAVASAISDVLGLSPQYVVSPGTYDQKHID
ncbi:MAG: acetylornithine deacetylase/succinyl-diaminopimelate desuccinylase family protein, partial [Hyphomicrobiales bacterium]